MDMSEEAKYGQMSHHLSRPNKKPFRVRAAYLHSIKVSQVEKGALSTASPKETLNEVGVDRTFCTSFNAKASPPSQSFSPLSNTRKKDTPLHFKLSQTLTDSKDKLNHHNRAFSSFTQST